MDTWGKMLGLTVVFYGIYIGLALLYARWRDARRRHRPVWAFEEGRDRVAPRLFTPRSPSTMMSATRDKRRLDV